MNILLFLDTETTGLNPKKHDIIHIAAVTYYDGEWSGTVNLSCQPFSYENISPAALLVNKLPIEKIKTFDAPTIAFRKFVKSLKNIRDNIGEDAKFRGIAHNAPFDKQFLTQWWGKCVDVIGDSMPTMKELIIDEWTDTVKIGQELLKKDLMVAEGCKLEKLATHFDVKFEGRGAHDALSDTLVLREVFEGMAKICTEASDSGVKLGATKLLERTYG